MKKLLTLATLATSATVLITGCVHSSATTPTVSPGSELVNDEDFISAARALTEAWYGQNDDKYCAFAGTEANKCTASNKLYASQGTNTLFDFLDSKFDTSAITSQNKEHLMAFKHVRGGFRFEFGKGTVGQEVTTAEGTFRPIEFTKSWIHKSSDVFEFESRTGKVLYSWLGLESAFIKNATDPTKIDPKFELDAVGLAHAEKTFSEETHVISGYAASSAKAVNVNGKNVYRYVTPLINYTEEVTIG